jgi:hypothetical protein
MAPSSVADSKDTAVVDRPFIWLVDSALSAAVERAMVEHSEFAVRLTYVSQQVNTTQQRKKVTKAKNLTNQCQLWRWPNKTHLFTILCVPIVHEHRLKKTFPENESFFRWKCAPCLSRFTMSRCRLASAIDALMT